MSGWPRRPTTGWACSTSTRASRAPGPRPASASSCCACAPRCANGGWAIRRARSTRCCGASRWRPTDKGTQEEILRLARVTGRWEEAIRVEGQLFALAESLDEKLSVARNAAYLVEHEVKDLVRAFRAYLNAFRLAPDDDDIVGHLWRLAARIGRYDKFAADEAAAALAAAAVPGATVITEAPAGESEEIPVELDDAELHPAPPARRGGRGRR